MPETTKVNLNQIAVFTLTPRGLEIIKAKNAELAKLSPLMPHDSYRPGQDGKMRMALWNFSLVFGAYMHMGCDPPVAMWFELEAF